MSARVHEQALVGNVTQDHAVDSVGGALREALAGRYEIQAECGRGGTSIVYRARDLREHRLVAIKVMHPELSSSATAERFLREVRIAGALEHPHVARLLDSGEAAGQLYCVFPFIDGETLRARLAREGPLPVAEAMRLAKEIGDALSYAHAHGVIHRDVKPENILISDGHAILGDFGIARAVVVAAGDRLTDSGIAVGTPSYMSPEQAVASPDLDARSDQYALAVCLYEMLAGDPPFIGRTTQAIIARLLTEPPPRLEVARPTVAPGIVAAIERALSKVPADRYRSVAAFLAALASPDTRLVRARERRSPMVGAAATLAVVSLAGSGWWYLNRAPVADATRVVVFPARTSATGSDPEAGLRIADAIQIAVEHTEPLRWIPAWDDLDSATRADPGTLQLGRARALALRRGARYFVTSVAGAPGGRNSVTVLLHDAVGDSLVERASVVDSLGGVPPSALAIRALPRLLARMLDPRARVDLSPLTDRKLAAIARLLEGEEAYRSARFATAFERYRQAVAEDSSFAYAAIKGAQAASWQNRLGEAIDLIRVARANESLLPPKYRPYLNGVAAYLDGRGDDAVASFRQALGTDRYWAEAAMALGDTYYHLMPTPAPLDSLARDAFVMASALDSTFTPPLFHLAEISAREGERDRARELLMRLQRGGADASWTRHVAVMLRCLEGRLPAAEWRAIAAASPDEALMAAHALAGGGRQPRCALDGFRAILDAGSASVGTAWAAALGLNGMLMAVGRTRDAVQLLDSARAAISVRAYSFAVLEVYADSAFADMGRAAEAFAVAQFGPHYERASTRPSWAFGMWEAWKGNADAVETIAARLAREAAERPTPRSRLAAASLAARLSLLRGDTAAALRRLSALPVVAPRDSLSWEYFEPLATDRLTLATLLLQRGRPADAIAQASAFDHQEPVAFLPFIRPSLELRARAAEQLGQGAVAARFRARLRALDAAGRAGA